MQNPHRAVTHVSREHHRDALLRQDRCDVRLAAASGRGRNDFLIDYLFILSDREERKQCAMAEVVIDGEFKESFFRAAPYFDLNIDGITLPEGM